MSGTQGSQSGIVGGAVAFIFGKAIVWGFGLTHGLAEWRHQLILLYTFSPLINMAIQPQSFWLGFLLNERNMEFLLGCVAAAIVMHSGMRSRWLQLAVIIGITLLVGWAAYINSRDGREVASFTVTFGMASFLIVLGLAGLEQRSPFRLPRSLVYLGDASYSIYLAQLLLLNLYFVLIRLTGLGNILHPFWISSLGIAFILVGGSMCYAFLERPLLKALKGALLNRPAPSEKIQPVP